MDLPPFLLDHWLAKYSFASPPIAYDLASSTGPKWTVGELLSLGDGADLDNVTVGYAPPEGGRALREAIGTFLGVDPDWVVVTTGASEALSILFCLVARPGGNVVLPSPGFPAFDVMANVWGLGVRQNKLARENGYRQFSEDVLAAVDRDGRDSRPFCEALAATGVLVAPGDCFAMPDHMRVGFAVLKAERFAEALAIFENTLREQ